MHFHPHFKTFRGVCVLYPSYLMIINSCYVFSFQLVSTLWVDKLSMSQMFHWPINLLPSDRNRQQSRVCCFSKSCPTVEGTVDRFISRNINGWHFPSTVNALRVPKSFASYALEQHLLVGSRSRQRLCPLRELNQLSFFGCSTGSVRVPRNRTAAILSQIVICSVTHWSWSCSVCIIHVSVYILPCSRSP